MNEIKPVTSVPTLATLPDVAAAIADTQSNLTLRLQPGLPSPLQGVPVATRCYPNLGGFSNGTDTGANFQMRHYVLYDTYALRLVYFNPATRSNFAGTATIVQNPIVVKSAICLTPNGGTQGLYFGPTNAGNVTWGGQPSITIMPGKYAVSDPVLIPIGYGPGSTTEKTTDSTAAAGLGYLPAGDFFYTRTFVTGPNGIDGHFYYPTETLLQAAQFEGSSHSPAEFDETQMTPSQLAALASGTNTGAWAYNGLLPPDRTSQVWGPVAILGTPLAGAPVKPLIILIGDSIMQGAGDAYTSNLTIAGAVSITRGYMGLGYDTVNYGSLHGIGAWSRAMEALKQPAINVSIFGITLGILGMDVGVWDYANACQYQVLQVGTNNLVGYTDGASDTNVAANVAAWYGPSGGILQAIRNAKARGIKTILVTYLPRTGGDGKTPDAWSHTYKALNNYLRANWQALGAVGLIDWTLAIETQSDQVTPVPLQTGLSGIGIYSSTVPQQAMTDGGCWATASSTGTFAAGETLTTVDGTHPSPVGHTVLQNFIVANLPGLLK